MAESKLASHLSSAYWGPYAKGRQQAAAAEVDIRECACTSDSPSCAACCAPIGQRVCMPVNPQELQPAFSDTEVPPKVPAEAGAVMPTDVE